jgi:hypothetical protein
MSKIYYFYKIYKDEFCYIGSTCDLNNRKIQHKSACNNENNKLYNRKVYKTIRANGGWDCFTFQVIKQFDNLTEQEARVIERVYIEEFGNLNMVNSIRTKEDEKKEQQKYYLNNQNKIKENVKQYQLNNKEKIKLRKHNYYLNNIEQVQQYHLNNRDKILERQKKYREDNQEYFIQYRLNNRDILNQKSSQKITCECGCIIRRDSLSKHKKTKIHQDYLVITFV